MNENHDDKGLFASGPSGGGTRTLEQHVNDRLAKLSPADREKVLRAKETPQQQADRIIARLSPAQREKLMAATKADQKAVHARLDATSKTAHDDHNKMKSLIHKAVGHGFSPLPV